MERKAKQSPPDKKNGDGRVVNDPFFSAMMDITAKALRTSRDQLSRTESLAQVGPLIGFSTTLESDSDRARRSDYEKIVDDAVVLMRSDYASLQMLFPERGSGGELRLLAFRGFNPQAAQFWEWVHADSKSTCGIALRDKRRVVAPDIAACDFMAGSNDQRIYLQTGIRACQTTPLIGRGGNVLGMISTHWTTAHQFSEENFLLFDSLARQAAELIDSPRW